MKPVLAFMQPATYHHKRENSSFDLNMGRSIKYV